METHPPQLARLPNGLTLITERVPGRTPAALGVWLGAGSAHDPPHQRGLAHFLEHMLFKGTQRRTGEQIDRLMARVGADLNGYVDKEHTCFVVRCLGEHLPLALDVLADMVLHSRLAAEDLEKEKGVVAEEIAQYEDSPEQVVDDALTEVLWGDHPLSGSTLGKLECVEELRRQDLLDFTNTYCRPPNIVVAAAGDIEHEQLAEAAAQHFAGPLGGAPQRDLPALAPRGGTTIIERDGAQAHVCLGARGHARADDDLYAERVISVALGVGAASRLFREVREKRGLAYSVGSYANAHSCGGCVALYAGARPGAIRDIVSHFRRETADIAAHGLRPEELEETRDQLRARIILSLDDVGARAEHLAESWLYLGRLLPVEEILDRLAKVSARDVQRVAHSMFAEGPLALAAIGPLAGINLEGESWQP